MRIGMGCRREDGEAEGMFIGGVAVSRDREKTAREGSDLLIGAVMDALLGAAALGDVKRFFGGNTDENTSDFQLLARVGEALEERLYVISNIDASVNALNPDLSGCIDEMCQTIAQSLKIRVDQVNVKVMPAGFGMESSNGSICAQAIASIDSIESFSYAVDLAAAERNCSGCQGCAGKEIE